MSAFTKLRLAGIGCGSRTRTYFQLATLMPDRYECIAAADPNPKRLALLHQAIDGHPLRTFASDKELLAAPQLADVLIIGTQDAYHYEPALAALEKGYDLLLEKPIAQRMEEIVALDNAARQLGRKVLICHVLRYAPFYRKVKEIIASGALGDIISLNATEGVGAFHQAHSFVRGHWSVCETATPMIVAKSCHDMDLIHWLMGRSCETIASAGDLSYFTARNAPADAPPRCTDGCPVATTCIYNAELYTGKHKGWLSWVFDDYKTATPAQIRDWLRTSPWGRCVFHCDNSAVDHQVVAMGFAGCGTATFTMTAFSEGRTLDIYGTKARLTGGESLREHAGADLVVTEHGVRNVTKHHISHEIGGYAGHGGGDPGLMVALYDEMRRDRPEDMLSSLHKSVESHAMAFAAEESRRTGQTVRLKDFYGRFGAVTV